MVIICLFVIFEEKLIRMDLSDILPLLIIVGGALISLVGKSSKGKPAEEKPVGHRPQAEIPPIPAPMPADTRWDNDLIDDWILSNDKSPLPGEVAGKQKKQSQTWELEGQRSTIAGEKKTAEPQQPTAVCEPTAAGDPNYAIAEDSDGVTPQDWRKAIIAYEILKTKF